MKKMPTRMAKKPGQRQVMHLAHLHQRYSMCPSLAAGRRVKVSALMLTAVLVQFYRRGQCRVHIARDICR